MAREKITIKIGNKEYELVLTALALEELLNKLGCDFEDLGANLEKELSKTNPVTFVGWLVTTLANQSILIKNELDGTDEKLLDEKKVKLFINLEDLTSITGKVLSAITAGLKRTIESDEEPKNTDTE